MKSLSNLALSVFAYLGSLGRLQWKKHFVHDHFMELSGIHWETMFYSYLYTDSR